VREGLLIVVVAASACGHAPPKATTPLAKTKLVTLATESDTFPDIANAASTAIANAKIAGVDETVASKVSIEVVQLSIECVDSTAACYGAAAKSLSANKLLFAQVADDNEHPRVTVTLFDASTNQPKATERTFDSEAAAVAGVGPLVSEATR
jgi:hypothetical protein